MGDRITSTARNDSLPKDDPDWSSNSVAEAWGSNGGKSLEREIAESILGKLQRTETTNTEQSAKTKTDINNGSSTREAQTILFDKNELSRLYGQNVESKNTNSKASNKAEAAEETVPMSTYTFKLGTRILPPPDPPKAPKADTI